MAALDEATPDRLIGSGGRERLELEVHALRDHLEALLIELDRRRRDVRDLRRSARRSAVIIAASLGGLAAAGAAYALWRRLRSLDA
jgi:hypothetical protein